jgi:hypothetical protein
VTWVSWRLQRTETLIALGILALLTALLVPTGISMANAYHQDGLGACLTINPDPSCANAIADFQTSFQSLWNLANFFTLVPGLIGVALAAPFILDLEHGTYRLAWTQSITRGRWLAGKIGLPVIAALLASGVLILLSPGGAHPRRAWTAGSAAASSTPPAPSPSATRSSRSASRSRSAPSGDAPPPRSRSPSPATSPSASPSSSGSATTSSHR